MEARELSDQTGSPVGLKCPPKHRAGAFSGPLVQFYKVGKFSRAFRLFGTPARRRAAGVLLSLLTIALAIQKKSAGAGTAQDSNCPVPPVIATVSGAAMYSDKAGSQVDIEGLRRNNQLIAPLRAFDGILTGLVDNAAGARKQDDLDCAGKMLAEWAAGGAMLEREASFAATRSRQRFTIGINIAAIKLQRQGNTLDPAVISWLQSLNAAIINDFDRRNIVDNLYVWSAVDAASFSLLSGDAASRRYQDKVWARAVAQIGPDGFVPSELRRASRALLYHQYYLSALLYLGKIRIALNEPPSQEDVAALHRLAERVAQSLCNPKDIQAASGGLAMEPTPADQFAVPLIFSQNMLDDRFKSCGAQPPTFDDPTLGGELTKTFKLLEAEPSNAVANPVP